MYGSNPTLDAVLDYSGWGLSVIPLKARDKKAAVRWEAYQHTPADVTQLGQWFGPNEYNVGIVTGEVSGIVVVDVDKPELFDTFLLPPTPSVKTGKGAHYYICPMG